jgi:hypothetical protein
MLIKDNALRHWIDNFYGYGSWNAKFWFVAYEAGGGDTPEEVAEKLDYFYDVHSSATGPTLCDIRKLYKKLMFTTEGPRADKFTNLHDYRFGDGAIVNGVWKNLIAFVHGYRDKKLPDILAYQKDRFAAGSEDNEALIQLYPLPSPHNHAWYYSWLDMPQFGFLKSRSKYEEHVYSNRINDILQAIRKYKPELVLMYGMSNINTLKESVQEVFPGIKFKMEKAVKLKLPQHHRVDIDGTRLLITTQIPALRHGRVETGFDWEEFGKITSH